jgi:hypothetical protein
MERTDVRAQSSGKAKIMYQTDNKCQTAPSQNDSEQIDSAGKDASPWMERGFNRTVDDKARHFFDDYRGHQL